MRFVPIIMLTLIQLHLFAQDPGHLSPKYQNISIDNGLSNMSVLSICQDSMGFIWVGTARGLNRYDGLKFRHFFYNDDSTSLYHDFIGGVFMSSENKLYCSTTYGLNYYDIMLEKMVRVPCENERIFSIAEWNKDIYTCGLNGGLRVLDKNSNTLIRLPEVDQGIILNQIRADGSNGLWCTSLNDNLLVQYIPNEKLTQTFKPSASISNRKTILSGPLEKVYNYLLVGSNNGILVFDISLQQFIPMPAFWSSLNELTGKELTFISGFDNRVVYFGTKENGLYFFDLNELVLKNSRKSPGNRGLSSDFLTSIFKDRDQNLWIGTFDQGLDISFQRRKNFNTDLIINELTDKQFITSIESDELGTYYIGTRYNGLIIYDSQRKKNKVLRSENGFLQCNHIRSLFIDSQKKLWIGTEKKLYTLDLITQKMRGLESVEPNNGIVCFCESDGKVFAGTDVKGLLVYNLAGNLIDTVQNLGINITQVISIPDNKLIISSYGVGIFQLDYPSKSSARITAGINIPAKRLIEAITMYYDSEGTLWIGNFKYGLYKFNIGTGEFRSYSTRDGLPSNDITGIMEDAQHYLWISTAYGLSRFDKKEGFINFNLNEGVENLQFHQKAVLQDHTGTIFFGGNNGLTYFNPKSLGIHFTSSPKIVLESLRVSNKLVLPGDETKILKKNIGYTDQFSLSHKFPVFSIEYLAFDYIAAKNLKYAYLLEGFDKSWNYVDNRTYANYSNLYPGEYVFRVKAQNNNGIWTEQPVEVKIKILPAPWKTIWAQLGYFCMLAVGILITFRLILRAQLLKKELDIEHNERLREQEINQMKLRFFTNISHEIRTPLTLIKGNVEQIASSASMVTGKEANPIKSLKFNTERLLKLINELLSFRKLENDNLGLEISRKDLIAVSREIVNSFDYLASTKKIELIVDAETDALFLPLDQDNYEKILSNLVSNAIKFSHFHSAVVISIRKASPERLENYPALSSKKSRESSEYVEISVGDQGKGIPESLLPHIFDRYMQVTPLKPGKPDYSGTGIGLYFTKRLVELHKGCIRVTSKTNESTVFSFILPLDDRHYSKEDWISRGLPEENLFVRPTIEVKSPMKHLTDKKTVLIVEDDPELNRFICQSLANNYLILKAFDGEIAFKMAQNQLPDIIVTDIMMPKIDGITLCNMLRDHKLISHIPIILLTAKTDLESQISGLNSGADDYISKPFEMDMLKARIDNLIHQRIRLQKIYQQGSLEGINPAELNKFEFRFMKKIDMIIQEQYKDPDFNVQVLADKINMSRTNFYRKFMRITSITPKDYLTRYRIEKSIELIRAGSDNFGEISFLSGFSSQSIFTLSFKKIKGITPLNYRRELFG